MLIRFYVKMAFLSWLSLAAATPGSAHADPQFSWEESQPLSELWLNPGMISYHYQRNKNLNDFNPGLGFEYRYSTISSVTAGFFYNSDREYSRYAGMYWQPAKLGQVRLGLVAGGFDGYPKMNHGGWFLAAIPIASIESGNIGFNFALIPAYKDRLYGALTFQLKYKFQGK